MAGKVSLGLVTFLGPHLLLSWGKSLRIRFLGEGEKGRRVIYALWHGRMFVLIYFYRRMRIDVLISQHSDGELVTRVVKGLGYLPVRGSSTRGGLKGFFELSQEARGRSLAITPDGPRGPREVVQPGIILLAQRTGLPIVPLGASAQKRLVLPSWDGFLIPHPFSRAVVIEGPPLWVERSLKDGALEEKRGELERRLREINRRADNFFSR